MRASDRLAELLNDALKPDQPLVGADFWIQQGAYRHRTWDLARWGAWVRVRGLIRSIHSWDTMTECVRHGITITQDGTEYEVTRRG